MKGDSRLINVRRTNGEVARISRGRATELVSESKATFISNTLFKAAQAGVSVSKGMSDSQIKKAIRLAKKPEPKPKEEASSEVEKDPKKRKKRGIKSR